MGMTLRELAALGAEMRSAQKHYFRTRSSSALECSKALERRFDSACGEVLRGQAGLFDGRDQERERGQGQGQGDEGEGGDDA